MYVRPSVCFGFSISVFIFGHTLNWNLLWFTLDHTAYLVLTISNKVAKLLLQGTCALYMILQQFSSEDLSFFFFYRIISYPFSFSAVYLIIMLAWGVMAVILTIYVLKCHHSPPEKPIPNYLRKFCFVAAKLGCFHNSCFNRKNAVGKLEKGEEAGEVNKTQIELEPELTWPEVTMILDNFFFKWYALVLGSVTLCVLLTLMISYYT